MKLLNISRTLAFLIMVTILTHSCKKMTTPTPLSFYEMNPVVKSEEYYEALRNYKKSDHPIAFGWWGASGNSGLSPDMTTRFLGLPDSLDIVSLWGGIPKDSAVWNEMQHVRKLKGTQFLWVIFGSGVENLMKLNDSALFVDDLDASIEAVAKAISDTIDKYQIDGFDLDYEPGYGDNSIFGNSTSYSTNSENTQKLFKALSQYLGPMSGTDKILMIDGQSDIGIEPYINYYAQQAYNSSSFSALQSRFRNFGGGVLPSKKFIVTENMQSYGGKGVSFNYQGRDIGSVLGMALWNPDEGRKGGFGGYLIEYDAKTNLNEGSYYHLRQGIQLQNPAAK